MKRTKEEYQKLWEETEKYYSDASKCAIHKAGYCLYLAKNGNKCAVGRALNINHPKYKKIVKMVGEVQEIPAYAKVETLDELLYPRYRGYTLTFWKKLQVYHDTLAQGSTGVTAARRIVKEYIRKLK